MTDELKVLGQDKPAGTTLTDLYTVGSLIQTTTSTLAICNQSGSGEACRVSVAPLGASDTLAHYLYYDKSILANDSVFLTIGMTLQETDIVRVYSASGNISFTLFGVETE
jgi:hypothetical protein